MRLVWKEFSGFSLEEMYQILKLRIDVFVVEQNCPWSDLDNCDQFSWHLAAWQGDRLAGCARLMPPDAKTHEVKLQRIITAQDFRGQGLGNRLVEECLKKSGELFPNAPIKIGAQARLEEFYRRHGFAACSDVYDDLGILHVDMIRLPAAKAA